MKNLQLKYGTSIALYNFDFGFSKWILNKWRMNEEDIDDVNGHGHSL